MPLRDIRGLTGFGSTRRSRSECQHGKIRTRYCSKLNAYSLMNTYQLFLCVCLLLLRAGHERIQLMRLTVSVAECMKLSSTESQPSFLHKRDSLSRFFCIRKYRRNFNLAVKMSTVCMQKSLIFSIISQEWKIIRNTPMFESAENSFAGATIPLHNKNENIWTMHACPSKRLNNYNRKT